MKMIFFKLGQEELKTIIYGIYDTCYLYRIWYKSSEMCITYICQIFLEMCIIFLSV